MTRNEIAQALNKTIEEVAIRTAGNYTTHIVINGHSYCGRIDNDGYNLQSEFEKFTQGRTCQICVKRLDSAILKATA